MTRGATNIRRRAKLGHVRVLALSTLKPSPENDTLYRPVRADDPAVQSLVESVRANGILEPLVITQDRYIISGHRRYEAAHLAGLSKAPCRIEPFRRNGDLNHFVRRLREHNRQREKSLDEKLREEIVSTDTDEAYASLLAERRERAKVQIAAMKIVGAKKRCEISDAKQPMLDAIEKVLNERRNFWPLSDRQIHYALLNDPPLIHARKLRSKYRNDLKSYKALTDLLTRARLAGLIPFEAIADETRPVTIWEVHREPATFVRQTLDRLFTGYYRDRMQSQPNYIEIVGEKNTLRSIIEPIAGEYCIPLTTGRGYCSLPPRRAMAQRFHESGSGKLIILILSDHDPDGEEIAQSFARSMRDDFEIDEVHPIKVALTAAQVKQFNLPQGMIAKASSSQHAKFVQRYGKVAYELEALAPHLLQRVLRDAIDSVIDTELYNREVEAEHEDARYLAGLRKVACEALASIQPEGPR